MIRDKKDFFWVKVAACDLIRDLDIQTTNKQRHDMAEMWLDSIFEFGREYERHIQHEQGRKQSKKK